MSIHSYLNYIRTIPVVKNLLSLGILQLMNYLMPLITVPYLILTIGLEKYGIVAIAQALIGYFLTISDFGFNLISTRLISINKNNIKALSKIYSDTISAQIFLLALSFSALLLCVNFIPKFQIERTLFLYSFLIVIGQVILPVWFFQGIEKMKFITMLSGVSKILSFSSLFFFIKSPSDYLYVPVIFSIGNIVSGIIGLILIKVKYHVSFAFSSAGDIFKNIKTAYPVFISSFAISIYSNSGIVILGIFGSNITVGEYSVAEKVMQIVRQALAVYSQAIYPQVCQLAVKSLKDLRYFFKLYFIPFFILMSILCLLIILFSSTVTQLITGTPSNEISILIRIILIIPVIVALNIPFYQTLLAFDSRTTVMVIFITAAALNLMLNFILAPIWGAIGTCVALLATELLITTLLIVMIQKDPSKVLLKS